MRAHDGRDVEKQDDDEGDKDEEPWSEEADEDGEDMQVRLPVHDARAVRSSADCRGVRAVQVQGQHQQYPDSPRERGQEDGHATFAPTCQHAWCEQEVQALHVEDKNGERRDTHLTTTRWTTETF